MIRNHPNQAEFIDFIHPFGGKLPASNRWAKLSRLIPWEEIEALYAEAFPKTKMGAPALSGRIAFGALIIKERLAITDEETVAQIQENLFLQYFLGLHQYVEEPLFDTSMMVHFRKRFSQEDLQRINDIIIANATERNKEPAPKNLDDQDPPSPPSHGGKLLVDATCTPADITYPTDLNLLNQAREKTESFIDLLHAPFVGEQQKPRTYRIQARKKYLTVAKQKRPGSNKMRKALRQQLGFLKRNLSHIDNQLNQGSSLNFLSHYQLQSLQVIHTLHSQQLEKYKNGSNSIPDRIVSIAQPHIRPIVRGKSGKSVEFGAKISLSHFADGYVAIDKLSWDAYNECGDLIGQIERYKDRFGYYPESVHADTIYRNRFNRDYCKNLSIRLTGKPLGRPPKQTEENKHTLNTLKKQRQQDERDRIPVEGKFGNAKRKGSLGRIMAKLSKTAESVIHIGIIVLNLDKHLREVLCWLITRYLKLLKTIKFPNQINNCIAI
ncbi:IS5 family transposase [Akkermansiaceae bacterium]|nr:IS5 family transposase [Akkermansiaceae bacterium]